MLDDRATKQQEGFIARAIRRSNEEIRRAMEEQKRKKQRDPHSRLSVKPSRGRNIAGMRAKAIREGRKFFTVGGKTRRIHK